MTERIFNVKTQLIRALQERKTEEEKEYRNQLVEEQMQVLRKMDDTSFRVKLHYRYVEKYIEKKAWTYIETIDVSDLKEHIAPIIVAEAGDEYAKRFDLLMYSIALAHLQSANSVKLISRVVNSAEKLKNVDIPQIKEKKYILDKITTKEFWDDTDIIELDMVREEIRDLIQYLPKKEQKIYTTNFDEEVLEEKEGESLLLGNELTNYKKRVESYLKEHQDNLAVYKLRNNKKITESDLKELERVLWKELGTKAEYEKEYGDTPVGKLVRKIVGTSRIAVNEAFSEFLTEEKLNVNQMRFVRLIVDYIVLNGNIEDNSVFTLEPFKSSGSITTIFKDDLQSAKRILSIVEMIRKNSEEIA